MTTHRTISDVATLELYRLTMANSVGPSDISVYLAEHGYDADVIKKGTQLCEDTEDSYYKSSSAKGAKAIAYASFMKKRTSLNATYLIHRKKAGLVFRKEKSVTVKLAINKPPPKAYVEWLVIVRKFYTLVAKSKKLQEKLAKLNISAEDIDDNLARITELESARAEYVMKKGEAQNATKRKEAAFDECYDWMRDFYVVAKIAFSEHPDLIVAFGKVVDKK